MLRLIYGGVLMRRALIGSLVASVLLFALGAQATEKWDQAKVTALAGELANSVSGLRQALMNSDQWQNLSASDPSLWGVAEDLRMIDILAMNMNADLSNGAGMAQTLPAYLHIQEIHSELSTYQGQIYYTQFLAAPLAKAKASLAALAAYYPPHPMKRY